MKSISLAKFLFSGIIVTLLAFPYYSLIAVDEVFSNEYWDLVAGNVLFALFLIWSGRFIGLITLFLPFQRALDITIVHIWGGGEFSQGISRQVFLNFQTSNSVEIFGYFKSMYMEFILGFIFIVFYMIVYIYFIRNIWLYLEKKRKNNWTVTKIARFSFGLWFVFFAFDHKVKTDIFFFQNNRDTQLKWFISENTYPNLTSPVDKKIDLYFIIGESVTHRHMSLYGYERKTTPYLDSQKKSIDFYKGISPAGTTFNSYSIMFSRLSKMNEKKFYLSPNMIEELNNMGYQTLLQTYHKARRSLIFESLEDSFDKFLTTNNVGDDEKMIQQLQNNMSDIPTAYFINMYGSHPYYDTVDKYKTFSKIENGTDKKGTINRYDDTIIALDDFIKQVKQLAENHYQKTGRKYVIIYVSDHGQVLYANDSDLMGHTASKKSGNYGFNVPLIIFNKQNLPCGVSELDDKNNIIDTGRIYNIVLEGLCGFKANNES